MASQRSTPADPFQVEVFGRSHIAPKYVCRLRGGILAGLAGPLLRHGLWASFSPEFARHCDIDDIGPCFLCCFRCLAAASLCRADRAQSDAAS